MIRLLALLFMCAAPGLPKAHAQPSAHEIPTVPPKAEPQVRKPLPSPEDIARLPADGGPEYNRLIFEKSPYLLQHATNPVDWYPWGDAAFEKARREDKPVFLSIGYSTCHWCHVMEHESFEDPEVAEALNRDYVAIKVDREERPDLDTVFMNVTVALSGNGGWPMSLFLTPERKPFYAATYLPKRGKFSQAGMMDILPEIAGVWRDRREDVLKNTRLIEEGIQREHARKPGHELDADILKQAYQQLSGRYDKRYGGFGMSPKFPSPHLMCYLLRYWNRTGDANALEMVERTLQEMRRGGIYDQVGFGLHRYSTDADWLTPHFEKMLYDQAMLAIAATETWEATGKEQYKELAQETLTYVLRAMTSPEGGFYSAEDADSEGAEGKFYLWTVEQIKEVLGSEEGQFYGGVFDVTSDGNYHEEATGKETGQSILHLKKPLAEYAKAFKVSDEALAKRIEAAREKLFLAREKRVHPLKDDKILTDWNGLTIAALAKAGAAFGETKLTEAAKHGAEFILHKMRGTDGKLLHRFHSGEAGLQAHLGDYAFVVWGFIELYQNTFDIRYLHEALAFNEQQHSLFWDHENGGYYFTEINAEKLLVRPKETDDRAYPSGNSIAALNLIRLAHITGNRDMETRAQQLFQATSAAALESPSNHAQLLQALDFAIGPSVEVVISTNSLAEESFQAMVRSIRGKFVPNKVLLVRTEDNAAELAKLAPYTENQEALNNRATAYVCTNHACRLPSNEPAKVLELIEAGLRPQK